MNMMKKLNFRSLATISLAALTLSLVSFECHGATTTIQPQVYQDFTHAAKEAIPAVVSIRVKGKSMVSDGDQQNPFEFFNDPFWQKFFGNIPKDHVEQEPIVGQASGFIVSPDGYIMTNAHVVKDMSEIVVATNEGKEYPAKVIGADSNTDIALIKIDAKELPFLTLGNSDDLEVGQWVMAVGNPLGLQASVTAGIVSAKGRNNLDLSRIEDFIQTDAAINRGNSGGPLLNLDGNVIGMNTAIVTNMATGGYMGIGFAIPSNLLSAVMEDLKLGGSFKRGFMGVSLQQVDDSLAQAFGLPNAQGALVAEISKDSPAEKAGLKQGDIILKYNNNKVVNIGALRNAIAIMKPGNTITLSILRGGKPMDIKVQIGTFPQNKPIVAAVKENKLGIEVETLTSDAAAKLGLPNEKGGVIIRKVDPTGPAAWAGLKKGAVIIEVNQKKVKTAEEFNEALQATPAGKPVLFLIKQGDTTRFVSLKVG